MSIESMRIPEFRPCDLCGNKRPVRLFGKNGYTIVRCPRAQCNLVYVGEVIPREELVDIYNEFYFHSRFNKDYLQAKKDKIRYFEHRLRRIEPWATKGRLLDIGCAVGYFLLVARRHGWQTFGVDVSEFASRYAREVFNLNVITGDCRDANFPNSFFDLITLWDVLEHVESPREVLSEVRRILRDNGLLVIETGDFSSLNSKLLGKNWSLLYPPNHLYFFSRRTLNKLLPRTGFRVIKLETTGSVYGTGKTFFEKAINYVGNLLHLGDVQIVYAKKA